MSHAHSHRHGGHGTAPAAHEGWSLLRAAAWERLAGAAVLLGAMWAIVIWALRS